MKSKKIKKIMSAAVSAITLLGVLSGCGGTETAKDGDVTVVRFWTNDGGGSKVWQEMIEEYNNTQGKDENIQIEYKLYSDSYGDILETAFESKQVAELVVSVGPMKQRVAKGQLKPFNEIPGWENVNTEYAEYIKENGNMFDGKVYTLPNNITTFGLIYNKDMFKAAGIVDENGEAKPPVTWDEYVEDAKKLTDASNNKYGVIFPMKWGAYWGYEGLATMDSSLAAPGLNRTLMEYDYESYAPFFEALMQIKKDGSYYPGPEGLDNDPARAQFAVGNIGMKFGASWDVGVLTDQFPAECDWDIAPFPVIDPNERYEQLAQYGSITSVSAATPEEKLEAVGKVLKWMYSDEVAVKLYEREINIPIKPGIADKANIENMSDPWKSAQKLVSISAPYKSDIKELPYDLKINHNITEKDVCDKIWIGDIDIQTGLQQLSEEYTKDLKKAFDELGENIDDYKLPVGYRQPVEWKED